jgi:hypothetical protein
MPILSSSSKPMDNEMKRAIKQEHEAINVLPLPAGKLDCSLWKIELTHYLETARLDFAFQVDCAGTDSQRPKRLGYEPAAARSAAPR